MLVYNPRAARGARGRLLCTAAALLLLPGPLLGLFRFSLRYVSPTLSTPAAVALQGVACTSS